MQSFSKIGQHVIRVPSTVGHGRKIKKFKFLLQHFYKEKEWPQPFKMHKKAKFTHRSYYLSAILLLSPKKKFLYFTDFELKLLLQHFRKETQ